MWMKSLQHSFKLLKKGIAGKRSETHNYSSAPRCCHNNFIVNTLVFFTSFTREVWRARGNSQAAGSLSVICTICLMTFSKSISLLPRDPSPSPSVLVFSWLRKTQFWASQTVNVKQAFRISRLTYFSKFFHHNSVMGKREGRGNLERQILQLELESLLSWKTILLAFEFCF